MAAHSLWNPFRIHRFTKAGNISVENHDGGKGRMRNDEARNVEYFIEKGEKGKLREFEIRRVTDQTQEIK